MINLTKPLHSIGLEPTPSGIKIAEMSSAGKNGQLIKLETLNPSENLQLLYHHDPILATGLSGKEVLIRTLVLPLTKEKDIQEALPFQAEPLLPYPAEQAFLAYQIVSKDADSTTITLLSVRQEALKSHVDQWKASSIEPEKVSAIATALAEFGAVYFPNIKNCLILHLQHDEMNCILIKEGRLCASFAQTEGLRFLLEAQKKEELELLPQSEEEWKYFIEKKQGSFVVAVKRLQKEAAKLGFALSKECRSDMIEGVIVTGAGAKINGLSEVLIQPLKFPLLACPSTSGAYSENDLLEYALPIGLALSSLPNRSHFIDFRQNDLAYPHPWKRLKIPVALYFAAMLLLTFAFYFYSQQVLTHQENQLKQTYVDFLGEMGKSYDEFEKAFAAKTSSETIPIAQLSQEDLKNRLMFLQKDLQAAPESFPLFPNIPRVSDLLTWLTQHPAAFTIDEEGKRQSKIQIESFNYSMLKRPQQGKKQEKYQVKVELEFSSPSPKWAREFHDALITPNDWIDPKGEVKWNSNRGIYKTSFFLKDKTVYPS